MNNPDYEHRAAYVQLQLPFQNLLEITNENQFGTKRYESHLPNAYALCAGGESSESSLIAMKGVYVLVLRRD